MEKINIIELLKDCPKGTKLYTTVWGDVEFIELCDADMISVLPISNSYNRINTKVLYSDGRFTLDGECIIFPSKENRDWSKFQRSYKDGDVVVSEKGDIHLLRTSDSSYCAFKERWNNKFDKSVTTGIHVTRFATEEEKETLFKVIKDNGYRWNAETKTLEKLIEPKFKVGDKIVNKNSISTSWIVSSVSSEYYGLKLYNDNERIGMLPVSNQDDWELASVVSKFKVGDRIRHKTHTRQGNVITEIKDTHYILDDELALSFTVQDEYELVPKKFDITTLEPFDKILVRQNDYGKWGIDFFGFYSEGYYHTTGSAIYIQCVPYKDNEHLRGTTNDCDEHYKNW